MAEPVVVYARGTPDDIARQWDICRRWAEHRHLPVLSWCRDVDGARVGWDDANRLVDSGAARGILTASTAHLPEYIRSVTKELGGRRPRRVITAEE